MEIEKHHILEAIEKMIACGKSLPQKDRIKFAKDQAEEQQKVLAQTVNLWWELFSKRHVSVDLWEQATDRALVLCGMPKLETSIINPALMSVAMSQIEKEYLEAQQTRYEQEKKQDNEYIVCTFPEMGKLIAYHMGHHKRPLLDLPPSDDVYKVFASRIPEEAIKDNMLQLRVYLCYWNHSKRDGAKMPVQLVKRANGRLGIDFI